jgi:hypothetical protein
MPGCVLEREDAACLWATHTRGNRSPRSDTDERKFGPYRIQELLLYLTCRADGSGPPRATNRLSSFLKESRKDDPARHFEYSTASSPCSPLQALNPSDRNKLLSTGYLKLVGIAISIRGHARTVE